MALLEAIDLFEQAADAYEQTLTSLEYGINDQAEADRIAAWLREVARAEREVGEVFLAQGR
jgi:1,2-phenylacetyl-CoA epoxidase catalytic subunit